MLAALDRIYRIYVLDLRARVDSEAELCERRAADRQLVIVILTVLASLIFMRYYGTTGRLGYWTSIFDLFGWTELHRWFVEALTTGENQRFNRRVFWAAARLVGYVVIPLTVASLLFRGKHRVSLRELFGFETRGLIRHAPAYLLMLLVIAPFVFGASFAESFQRKYPYYRLLAGESIWPWFFAWEILYALQFLALEVFYRGFMIHGLKRRLGYASVFVMMIPYMMIHFGKPLPECIGSIIAGFVLGTMSLKSGSIWWGAALHIIVAWAMDALSLWHQGRLAIS